MQSRTQTQIRLKIEMKIFQLLFEEAVIVACYKQQVAGSLFQRHKYSGERQVWVAAQLVQFVFVVSWRMMDGYEPKAAQRPHL